MSAGQEKNRHISAHNLPMEPSAFRERRGALRNRPAAAFLTQLLIAPAPSAPASASHPATRAYESVEHSDEKRLPAGYRKALSA